jgi:hypothetical protein
MSDEKHPVHPLIQKYVDEGSPERVKSMADAVMEVARLTIEDQIGNVEESGERLLDLSLIGLLVERGIIPIAEPPVPRGH